jgi:protein-S-isoprenylcysteine O-methyltransferase Ste14
VYTKWLGGLRNTGKRRHLPRTSAWRVHQPSNPIYLAFSLFQTGIALAVNDAWILVTLVPAICLMSFVVIPREERYLQARFGEEYTRYKASVRRWL